MLQKLLKVVEEEEGEEEVGGGGWGAGEWCNALTVMEWGAAPGVPG